MGSVGSLVGFPFSVATPLTVVTLSSPVCLLLFAHPGQMLGQVTKGDGMMEKTAWGGFGATGH